MSKTMKYVVQAFSVLIALMAIVVGAVLCFKFFDLLNDVFRNRELSNYSIISLVCLIVNLFLIGLVVVTLFESRDKELMTKVKKGLFFGSCLILLVMLVVYIITNTCSISSIYDIMKGSYFGDAGYNELEEAVAFVETLLQNDITICAIISSVATVVFCGCSIIECDNKATKESNSAADIQGTNGELTQNDQLKKEIEQLKQSLEMEDLKAEYTKLYKELQKKKSKE